MEIIQNRTIELIVEGNEIQAVITADVQQTMESTGEGRVQE